jgi:hypothetical protein
VSHPLEVALRHTHEWFEVNSGWAPPDPETLADWALEGACRAPDECWVPQRGVCAHGLVSWQVVLDELADLDAAVRSDDPHGAASPGVTGA